MSGLRFRNEINVRFGWSFPHPYCRPRRGAISVLYAQVKGKDKQQKEGQELPFPDFPSVEEGETGEEQKTPLPNEPENPLPDLPSNHPEEEESTSDVPPDYNPSIPDKEFRESPPEWPVPEPPREIPGPPSIPEYPNAVPDETGPEPGIEWSPPGNSP